MTILAEMPLGRLATGGFEPSAYLTDGLTLFRVVRGFSWPVEQSMAVLEDCRTLEERSYTAGELVRMGLSVVRPAETGH